MVRVEVKFAAARTVPAADLAPLLPARPPAPDAAAAAAEEAEGLDGPASGPAGGGEATRGDGSKGCARMFRVTVRTEGVTVAAAEAAAGAGAAPPPLALPEGSLPARAAGILGLRAAELEAVFTQAALLPAFGVDREEGTAHKEGSVAWEAGLQLQIWGRGGWLGERAGALGEVGVALVWLAEARGTRGGGGEERARHAEGAAEAKGGGGGGRARRGRGGGGAGRWEGFGRSFGRRWCRRRGGRQG